ncbi:hypothetical protein F5Y16DRAFT_369553 [Xylariaceae sp. FL0255]|nr:hypothetical protein F5Y16DRAFT_369553 [Xylariaceae sp. FL0255]
MMMGCSCLNAGYQHPSHYPMRGGVILNVSSMGGLTGYLGQTFYHARKSAKDGLSWLQKKSRRIEIIRHDTPPFPSQTEQC